MGSIHQTTDERDTRLENFAAELTSAVYPLMLPHEPKHGWLALELCLWKGLTKTARKWVRHKPPTICADELDTWREGLLGALSGNVVSIALNHGIDGHLRDVESQLHQTFHLLTTRYSHAG